ncbi:zinc finger protein 2 homolog isoform X1 [Belonocnema kinseyi]|uniref:zinc finger protein 2 homolog isoform X1 n=1 Tax=Belonocnema kinseyi TaxID=2817044 RepID=UPI00143DB845|nr:zinc finger protein 2 homolog isoform X1 [Belonocnema kinseyi]XP_033230519.1 zinc finger protein 2 homolog isoform X1 [Belonocnema kinseyi]
MNTENDENIKLLSNIKEEPWNSVSVKIEDNNVFIKSESPDYEPLDDLDFREAENKLKDLSHNDNVDLSKKDVKKTLKRKRKGSRKKDTLSTEEAQKLHQCKICNSYFRTARALASHDLIAHSKEKRYECDICKQKFSNHFNMELHIVAHMRMDEICHETNMNLKPPKPSKPFKCEVCCKKYARKEDLESHMLSHRNMKSFACVFCSKDFQRKYNLTRHEKTHVKKNEYNCAACGEHFNNPTNLQIHMTSHIGQELFECDICMRRFITRYAMQLHRIDHKDQTFKCKYCNCLGFPEKNQLVAHLLTHEEHKKSFVCNICSKRFGTRKYLNIHQRIHSDENALECEYCGKRFIKISNLRNHMRSHTTEIRHEEVKSSTTEPLVRSDEHVYKCENCGKTFITASYLKLHIRRFHTGKNPLECDICKQKFIYRSSIKRHVVSHMGDVKPDEPYYKCRFCEKSFSTYADLKVHKQIHPEAKPFECNVCKRRFTRKGSLWSHMQTHVKKSVACGICNKTFVKNSILKVHMRTHTGEKPYACQSCSKSFVTNNQLVVHMRTHTGERPFECDVCKQKYKHQSNLKTHKKSHCKGKKVEMFPDDNMSLPTFETVNLNSQFKNEIQDETNNKIETQRVKEENPEKVTGSENSILVPVKREPHALNSNNELGFASVKIEPTEVVD